MNVAGMVVQIRNPLGSQTSFAYDPLTLQRTRITDPAGHTTQLTYDPRGNLTHARKADDSEVSFAYDPMNNLIAAQDATGGRWSWHYDAIGQLTSSTNSIGEVTTVGWQDGLPSWIRPADGRWISYAHDEHKQIIRMTDNTGFECHFGWDNRGQQIRRYEAGGTKLHFQHDSESRLLTISRPSGERQRRTYDDEGHLLTVQDPRLNVHLFYSPDHHVIARQENGQMMRYEYDTEGRLIAQSDVAGHRHLLVRDPVGNVVAEYQPNGHFHRYTYDGASRLIALQSPAKREVKLAYDPCGRLIDVKRSDGGFTHYRYRRDGVLLQADNECSSVTFERDPLGRIVRESTNDTWVQSRFGLDGLRLAVESSDGLLQAFECDAGGSVGRMRFAAPNRRDKPSSITFQRDAHGHEYARTVPGDIRIDWRRDDRKRPIERTTFKSTMVANEAILGQSGHGEMLESRHWRWQGEDRLIGVDDAHRGTSIHYNYDALGRVIGEHRPDKTLVRAHDAPGNVYQQPDHSDCEYVFDGQLRKTAQAEYTYDDDGQRIERRDHDGATWRYTYDDRGMLNAIDKPNGQTIRYQYDAFGRRIRKVVQRANDEQLDVDIRYVWDGRRMLHERTHDGELTSWVWSPHDAAPLAKSRAGTVWSIVGDHMGNPTEMYDEHGDLAWQAQLDIFGRVEPNPGQAEDCPWRWPGQYDDRDAELYYNGFRYYDPATGNYISRDPLALAGSPNPYAYPANVWAWSDPLGLVQTWEEFDAAAQAWNAGEGKATPMDHNFMGQAWSFYQRTFKSSDRPVIGDFGDVARYIESHGPGHAKLSLPMEGPGFHWNTFVNDQWMQAFIDRRATIILATEPVGDALKSRGFPESVFAREMRQLRAAGYNLLGKLGDPKDPLRMEPPCK